MNENMWLIVGLGNPGEEFAQTRHNAGFILLDELSKQIECSEFKQKFDGLLAQAIISNQKCLLLKPQTYMNRSGSCVLSVANYYKIPLDKILVLQDDTNFKIGQIKIRQHGSAGGHKGINSIIEAFNSENFARIKIGVGDKPNQFYDLKDWVVTKFTATEFENLKKCLPAVKDSVENIVNQDIQKAMNKYNSFELK